MNRCRALKVSGKIKGNKATGTITYTDSPAPCDNRSFTAKYYGVHPKG